MKFTLSWLKDHLDTQASVDEIAEKLTAIGLEVESVDDPAAGLTPFVIGYVEEARKHPNADRLRVCIVNTGSETVQVVCGAPNARTGMKGVFAPSGSYIPGTDHQLKAGEIRGEASNGMLCSERELGLSDEHDGIIDLDADAPVGAPFAAYAGLDDPVFEIGITPNRADCLGVYGIARDLAAAGLGTLKQPDHSAVAGTYDSPLKWEIAPEEGVYCPYVAGRHFRNVKNGPSPKWMQQRLKAIGLRPISALVDITNYVTFDLGRPLHVFDADKVKGNPTMRLARGGETILALDGKEYALEDWMTVIADENGPEGIGGVMGGEISGCTEDTTSVFLECALFDAGKIAQVGRTLGINSDARYRFERGIDPASADWGVEVAARLVAQLCGGGNKSRRQRRVGAGGNADAVAQDFAPDAAQRHFRSGRNRGVHSGEPGVRDAPRRRRDRGRCARLPSRCGKRILPDRGSAADPWIRQAALHAAASGRRPAGGRDHGGPAPGRLREEDPGAARDAGSRDLVVHVGGSGG